MISRTKIFDIFEKVMYIVWIPDEKIRQDKIVKDKNNNKLNRIDKIKLGLDEEDIKKNNII